jgi:hypothetical protein
MRAAADTECLTWQHNWRAQAGTWRLGNVSGVSFKTFATLCAPFWSFWCFVLIWILQVFAVPCAEETDHTD